MSWKERGIAGATLSPSASAPPGWTVSGVAPDGAVAGDGTIGVLASAPCMSAGTVTGASIHGTRKGRGSHQNKARTRQGTRSVEEASNADDSLFRTIRTWRPHHLPSEP